MAHLDANRSRDHLLNISHVFDLRAYFNLVKNSKNHYFYKGFYQNWEGKKGSLLADGRSRLTFRKGSFVPRPENEVRATPDEIKIQRRLRTMSEEEHREEDQRLQKLTKQKMKELMKDRIKAEENFLHHIHKIQAKIKERQAVLYLGRTFVSFKSLDVCVAFLRMFQSYMQKEVLADANDPQFEYLLQITAKIAPFIDDLRWEHMYNKRHYYLLEISFVLVVSAINMVLEKIYNENNLNEMILYKKGLSDLTWLFPLVGLLIMQVLLSVISVVCLEKMISRYTFYKRSKKVEVNFVFFNFFMILNNIMVVFYGFLWAAYNLGQSVTEDKKYYFNFYINFQWIKNSLIIIFIPLLQRLIGDLVIKWFLIPKLSALCRKKKAKVDEVPPLDSQVQSAVEKNQEVEEEIGDGNLLQDIGRQAEGEEEAVPDDFSSEAESDEEEENSQEEEVNVGTHKRKKLVHDFGLNASYLIQVAFFTGFYLSFSSPMLLLITMVGVFVNYTLEDKLLKTAYEKTQYISISNLFVTLRWSFIAFCIGIVISVQNSKIYLYIINTKSTEISQIKEVTGFQNMIGYCNFVISIIFFFQMSTGKIMFRVLHSIDTLKRKFGGAFFKYDFEKVNYLSQNPFYSF